MSISDSYPENLLRAVRQMRHEEWYFSQGRFRDDDIWLASYPRSGSHFARFILVSARHFLRHGQYPADLSGMKTIPDVHGGRLEFVDASPRIIKTHFPRDPRYRRIIHLIRDPRDVMISYFHYSKGLPHLFSGSAPGRLKLPQFVELFLQGRTWPGDVREHASSYANRPAQIGYALIRYERLLDNPQQEYRVLLETAGIDFPAESLNTLIAHTSFASMRRLHSPQTARAGMVESNPVHILRCGVSGQHTQVLRDRLRERVQAVLGDYLADSGYC